MTDFIGVLSAVNLQKLRDHADDDAVDRLNHDITAVVLVAVAVVITTKNYVGDQIQCWSPGYFTSTYVDYTKKACWVTNTYYVPFDDAIPNQGADVSEMRINYYQWVHFFLICQAAMFYAPKVVWKALNGASGVSVTALIEATEMLDEPEQRPATLRAMARRIHRYLGHYRNKKGGRFAGIQDMLETRFRLTCGKKHGNYLTMLYMLTKIIYLGNALLQLVFMNLFLSTDFHWYGIAVLRDLAQYKEWPESSRFPRVTMCDFEVRQLGNNIHRHTVQCVLPINFFNERIYLFLWFWVVLIVLCTAFSAVNWFMRVAFQGDRVRYVKLHLLTMGKLKGMSERKRCRPFVINYLRQDGVFLLRLIGLNKDEVVVAELLAELWDLYNEQYPTEPQAAALVGDPDVSETKVL
ncbi:hypothetical protein NP493_8g05020 [Ridgeia piscesae]|uniref:Innexin n=1 Tax=Ridgeia piscesae TaxID=27915 RepID=A0AAD9ULB4_RIDPI|nr:hypothetical protein NP493_8g05020 [Ridgeia piscesae]